jgi:hypothetical protein
MDINYVSDYLNLQPGNSSAQTVDRGKIDGKKYKKFWGYSGNNLENFQEEWDSFEDGLNFLMQALTPYKMRIIELAEVYETMWWCGHFQSSFDGGPTLSAKVLSDISTFTIPMYIDNYFFEE